VQVGLLGRRGEESLIKDLKRARKAGGGGGEKFNRRSYRKDLEP